MRCPVCGHTDTKVVDSRTAQGGSAIRRRRICDNCEHRFTTYERQEESLPMIVKRDNRREPYNREKVLHGVRIACRKRPINAAEIESIIDALERYLSACGKREVPSALVGDQIMEHLRDVDQVAYVRFASVYQHFETAESFKQILDSLCASDGARHHVSTSQCEDPAQNE